MRAFLCLVVVAAHVAGAVNLAHVVESKATHSPFAAAVLAELNTHLEAGGPADELKQILVDIRQRITEASEQDKAGWDARELTCAEEQGKLDTAWSKTNNTLTINLGNQKTQEGIIEEATADEEKFTTQRDGFQKDMDLTTQNLQEAKMKREYGAEVYKNRTADTKECIDAVTEILSLEGNKMLKKNEGMTADDVNDKYDYTKGSTEFNDVAVSNQSLIMLTSKLHSEGAKELMTKTAQGYDYSDLKRLLDALLEELGKYKDELKNVEDQAIADYATEKAGLDALLAQQTIDRDTAETNRGLAEQKRVTAEGILADLKIEEGAIRKELADLVAAKAVWVQTCNDQKTDYDARVQDRKEELETLDKIEKIVDEKLGHLMEGADRTSSEDDVATAVDGVTSD